MLKGKFRHMPVLDSDRLVGLVSIGDALKWQIETIREHVHQLEEFVVEFELMRLLGRPIYFSQQSRGSGLSGGSIATGESAWDSPFFF